MPRSQVLMVTPEARVALESRLRSRKVSRSFAERARIVLLSADGMSKAQICERLDICQGTSSFTTLGAV